MMEMHHDDKTTSMSYGWEFDTIARTMISYPLLGHSATLLQLVNIS